MINNRISHLCICIFCAFILIFTLSLNFSIIGLVATLLISGGIFVTAFVFKKEKCIVENSAIYILLMFVGILLINISNIQSVFNGLYTNSIFWINPAMQYVSLIAGIILGIIFGRLSVSRKTLSGLIITRYISLFFYLLGFSAFVFSGINISILLQLIFIFGLFGLISYNSYATRTKSTNVYPINGAKPIYLQIFTSIFIAITLILLKRIVPNFALSNQNLSEFLNTTLFPWYSVLFISMFLVALVGIIVYYENEVNNADVFFISGILGLIWVIKASVFFWFELSWLSICVYALIFFGFTQIYINRIYDNQQTIKHLFMENKEYYWLPITAVSLVFSLILIQSGYIFFWLSLIVGLFLIFFANKCAVRWLKDAIFWISILLSISVSAIAFTLQNGYSPKKISIIIAIFIFTSIIMWMMNYKNSIGQNKFKYTKITISVIMAILVFIPAIKAGSHVKLYIEPAANIVSNTYAFEDKIKLSATADGKENSISKFEYVLTNGFAFNKEDVISLDATIEEAISINGKNHLIVWTEDNYGVVTKTDIWFKSKEKDTEKSINFFSIAPQIPID